MEQHHHQMHLLSSPHLPRFGPGPSLDLQLSISLQPAPPADCCLLRGLADADSTRSVEALKWEAAEHIRLAAMEKAYAEHVMELTRREMEQAQSEFMRARTLWERAREEVERAEKMKERAGGAACMEITCFSCRQKFRP